MIVNVLLVFALLYCLSSFLSVRAAKKYIKFKIKTDTNSSAHMEISNAGLCPVACCKVTVHVINSITGISDSMDFFTWLKPKSVRDINFEIKDNLCGCLRVNLKNIVISDMLGIFKREIKTEKEIKIYSMPTLQKTQINQESIDRYDMESFRYSQYKKGSDSSETFGISQYRQGDSVKAIHWKLSAKTGDLMIRDYSFPVDNRIMILADKKEYEGLSLSSEEKSKSTEFALSLSKTISEKGIEHSFGWYDSNRGKFIVKSVKQLQNLEFIIPEFLEAPFYKEEEDVINKFIESDFEKNYSGFILITNGEPNTERLMEYGEIDIYRP